LDRTFITKSDKKTIAKQYLWNKLQGRTSANLDEPQKGPKGKSVTVVTLPKQN
jgi:hypothetical protein